MARHVVEQRSERSRQVQHDGEVVGRLDRFEAFHERCLMAFGEDALERCLDVGRGEVSAVDRGNVLPLHSLTQVEGVGETIVGDGPIGCQLGFEHPSGVADVGSGLEGDQSVEHHVEPVLGVERRRRDRVEVGDVGTAADDQGAANDGSLVHGFRWLGLFVVAGFVLFGCCRFVERRGFGRVVWFGSVTAGAVAATAAGSGDERKSDQCGGPSRPPVRCLHGCSPP